MRFKSAHDLKSEILESLPARIEPSQAIALSIGIAPGALAGEYKIAIRVHEQSEVTDRLIAQIVDFASNEVDVRLSTQIINQIPPSAESKQKPLTLGSSIAHYRCSAGTLGFFAERISDGVLGFVSCNHIIAAEDTGLDGDQILSPAPSDGGTRSRNVVGYLDGSYARLRALTPVDCAFARIPNDLAHERLAISPREHLSPHLADSSEGRLVEKIGRTTLRTRGSVTAFDLDNLGVQYSFGTAHFDGQMEITPVGREPFSRPGDSGALIFTRDLRPLGLLYASTASGVAYAHPLQAVLTALRVKLVG